MVKGMLIPEKYAELDQWIFMYSNTSTSLKFDICNAQVYHARPGGPSRVH